MTMCPVLAAWKRTALWRTEDQKGFYYAFWTCLYLQNPVRWCFPRCICKADWMGIFCFTCPFFMEFTRNKELSSLTCLCLLSLLRSESTPPLSCLLCCPAFDCVDSFKVLLTSLSVFQFFLVFWPQHSIPDESPAFSSLSLWSAGCSHSCCWRVVLQSWGLGAGCASSHSGCYWLQAWL